ncbi:MAG: hypothetical protein RPS47_15660 [Colwellia sp.]
MTTVTQDIRVAVDALKDSSQVAAKFIDPAQTDDVQGSSGILKPLAAFEKDADDIVIKLGADVEVLTSAAEVEIGRIAHFEKETFVAGVIYVGPKIYFLEGGNVYTPVVFPFTASSLIQTDIDSGALTPMQGLTSDDIGRKGAAIIKAQDGVLALADLAACIAEDLEVGQQVRAQSELLDFIVVPAGSGSTSEGEFYDMAYGNQLKRQTGNKRFSYTTLQKMRDAPEIAFLSDGDSVSTSGHTAIGVGGLEYRYDAADTTSNDTNGTTIVIGGRRLKAILHGHTTPEMFGALEGVDSTAALINFFSVPSPRKNIGLAFFSNPLTVNLSGEVFAGKGSITCNTQDTTPFTFTGDDNEILFNMSSDADTQQGKGAILLVSGNRNKVKGLTAQWNNFVNPVTEGEQYNSSGISVTGNGNKVKGCTCNSGNTGITEAGFDNTIIGNFVNQACTGVKVTSRSRRTKVIRNILDGQRAGEGLQGCDGIWGDKSNRFCMFKNNTILNFGEHGAYLQGDSFTWSNNDIENSYRCALKVGAKGGGLDNSNPNGNYFYPDETPPTFNVLGESDPVGDYATFDSIISGGIYVNNQTSGATDGAVCLQPNIAGLSISNLRINGSGSAGFRTLYFNNVNDPGIIVANIEISDIRERNTQGTVTIAGRIGMSVDGFKTDQKLFVTGRLSPDTQEGLKLRNVTADNIALNRTRAVLIESSTCRFVTADSGVGHKIIDSTLTEANAGDIATNERFAEIKDSTLHILGDDILTLGSKIVLNNEFIAEDSLQAYPVQYPFNSTALTEGKFNDNTIKCPLVSRVLSLSGNVVKVQNNTLVNNGADDYIASLQVSNGSVSGNVASTGSLRFEATGMGNMVTGNGVKISEATPGSNIIGTNRV